MASRVMWASRVASYLRISIFLGGFSTVIKDLKYSDTHEWVKVDGSCATIGITDHAQGASFMGSKAFLDPTR
ncbi:Glycine cleavage system H protein [Musa troglodytarum]|uniref:Glycine cleavage system H protein n=1 Tax=Musa troglodytarum TaxID=320322 RepID=A0A9E7EQW2_9LILI|nr:Glycine cleavage system H protein [Musa troglodytarum]